MSCLTQSEHELNCQGPLIMQCALFLNKKSVWMGAIVWGIWLLACVNFVLLAIRSCS
jgi:hypothetical protein